ncbi:histidine kinase [Actinoplanes sp. SE50]|uniref:sensor histidine kinase n=1 Tax=unclassified Actinoplanes TaxID=2626549 RepID=UPI00023ED5F9|nr:Oxygen sensor histidine kinase nreB [Actinoplanes sp. SE50/110]ATO82866.1 histidine kinase [Actinoplanes sp. SE50]SLM00274.1 signal transduction histidine kinase [Actinoplanes sp. SE50/110]
MPYGRGVRNRTAWQAMAQSPLGFLRSAWPWRALAYLVSGVLTGALTCAILAALIAAGVAGLIVLIGPVFLLAAALSGLPVARLERRRLRLVDADRTGDPHQTPAAPGPRAWLRTRLAEPATWRELAFTLLSATALCWLDLVVLAFAFAVPWICVEAAVEDPAVWPWAIAGVLLLSAWPYTVTSWAGARAALTRTILSPRDRELGEQLTEVRRSRARLLGAFEAERVRIERDLHDGAQQRLVSLSMQLGLLRLDTEPDSALHRRIGEAQEQLTTALAELRDLVRGLNPQVLTDNGLVAAIEENTSRFTIPVDVDVRLPARLPHAVELAAYYVVTEAMTNIARHSGATTARITGRHHADVLTLQITDNGAGGVDPAAGTGMTGLADRLGVLDGRMRISSPPGGPTLIHVEIPCPFG